MERRDPDFQRRLKIKRRKPDFQQQLKVEEKLNLQRRPKRQRYFAEMIVN